MPMRRLITPIIAVATMVLLCDGLGRAADATPVTAPAAAPGNAARPAPPAGTPAGTPAAVVTLAGEVDDYNRDGLKRGFAKARRAGAKVVIVRIDTYGGLVTAALDISRFIKNQTDLHTIAFVDSKAISAGAMIALACDEIVMTPSGTLGDCAPIQVVPGLGVRAAGATERRKMESPILPDFEESATRNGYDPLLTRAMVSLPVSVHWVEDGRGRRRFVDDAEYKRLTEAGDWKPVPGAPDPVDSADTLLTVNTGQAVQYGLARGTAATAEALAAERGYGVVADLTPGFGDGFVVFFNNPFVRLVLIVVFLTCLFVALKVPGHGAPEAFALLTLALLVGIPLLTGYAQWWEIAVIFLGLALVAFEIFVFPGHMVSLIVGSLMVMGGLVLTFVGDLAAPGSWSMPTTWSHLQRGLYVIVGGLFCSMALFAWLRRHLPRLPYFNRLVLTATTGDAAAAAPARPPTDAEREEAGERWPFVGTVGVALSELKPGGRAEFPYGNDARSTSVVCECGYVAPGEKLSVREVRGNRVVVRPVAKV